MSWGILYIILQLNGGNLMRREVKAECRRILKEKWWSPLLIANLFIYFITFLFDVLKTHILGDINIKDIICGHSNLKVFIMLFFYLITLITRVLSLGITRLTYFYIDNREQPFSNIFYYFSTPKKFFSALWLEVNMRLRMYLWLLPPYIVIFLLAYIYYKYNPFTNLLENLEINEKLVTIAILVIFLIMMVYLIFSLFIINRYSLAEVIFIKNDGKFTANQSVKLSIKATKGHLGELFVLGLSLLPIILPVLILVLKISAFKIIIPFITTYISLVCVLYYKKLLENYEQENNTEVRADL